MAEKIYQGGLDTGFSKMTTLFGSQKVAIDPRAVFSDTFDGVGLDTVNRWVAAGTVIPTQPSGGFSLVNPGTAASASSSLVSQPALTPNGLNLAGFDVTLETTTIATGGHRFWGIGTQPGTWAAATPLQDAIGFEITTAGVLRAVVYSAGSVVFSQALTVPLDGLPHRYFINYLPGVVFFLFDNPENPISPFPVTTIPATQQLPVRIHSINALSTTVGTPTLKLGFLTILDFTQSASGITDGVSPWRAATVKQGSAEAVTSDSALVIDQRGATPFTVTSAATTNATAVGTAVTLYGLTATNTGGAAAFVKLYDKASAPTVGTDVPVLTIPVPAGGVVSLPFDTRGFRPAAGLALAITNLGADSDTTAVAAGQVKVIASYL